MLFGSIRRRIVSAINKVYSITSKGGSARVLHEDDKLKDDEIQLGRVAIPVPDDVLKDSISLNENMSNEELSLVVTNVIQNVDKQYTEKEPYDKVLDPTPSPITADSKPTLPDGWSAAYYPAGGETGGKPHIPSIKEWGNKVKLNHMTTQDLQQEYGKTFNKKTPNLWNDDMREKLVDSIAFMVARKIWYVGRRPSSMTDSEWDEHTKHMRPHQGSFSKNEHWSNGFPYGQEYTYRSWGHEEVMELKTKGKLSW